jgi:type VI secretion system protein ImpK
MRQADYFNEAIVTAMLAAEAGGLQPPAPPEGKAAPLNMPAPDGRDGGAALTRPPALRERLVLLLDEAVRRAVADGLDKDLADAADFAVCAFIDEILLSSAWQEREEWMRSPLQLVRHDTATAGEDFYRILDLLLDKAGETQGATIRLGRQAEEDPSRKMLATVLEIFAVCLSLGFTGMLFHDRAAIRDKLSAIGRFVPPVLRGLTAGGNTLLFPAAYPALTPRKGLLTPLRRFDGLDWLLWLAPLLLAGLLYYFYDTRLDALLHALTGGGLTP